MGCSWVFEAAGSGLWRHYVCWEPPARAIDHTGRPWAVLLTPSPRLNCYIARMNDLAGKHIVLGLSGGIACYKAAELCRSLIKEGATVQGVMTEAAAQFITPETMQALSGRPVFSSQWDSRASGGADNNMPHINLSREADAILVAPAGADFMAKLLHGRADELLSLMCLARPRDQVPLILAPAMNREMWSHPATQRNVTQLRADGATVLDVGVGDQACGETGDGRMLEPDELLYELVRFFSPKPLAGQQVLVSAGPTFEAIDPVRGLTNLSSGKMGFAIARAAHEAGAQVTLVAGPVGLPTPRGVGRINVKSALNMQKTQRAEPERQCVRLGRRGGGLAAGAGGRTEDQERRLGRGAHVVVRGKPRHPGRHRGQCPRPERHAVLRGLRGGKPGPAGPGAEQTRAQGRAPAGGQHRPRHLWSGRQRPAAGRRTRCDRAAPCRQTGAGAPAGGGNRPPPARTQSRLTGAGAAPPCGWLPRVL